MKKKFLLPVILALAGMFCLVGCGGPGFIMNPPDDPAELVRSLRANGWRQINHAERDLLEISRMAITVFALRFHGINPVLFEDGNFDPTPHLNTRIRIEDAWVFYFESEGDAITRYHLLHTSVSATLNALPRTLSTRFEIRRNGNIVSAWSSMQGLLRYFPLFSGETPPPQWTTPPWLETTPPWQW